ncbi:DeoR/GlpR family DNA-binding transcription regulator [Granulicella cerasi]|uniref:DeoR/GlpR family DNA-binding transcription regulator n=1 Tax=Granulicella cerasi TaxID=741063 RepID=A0ABW1Z7N5_9BACT|nr:DeoR/GlpR family DNA-binding transcription regulator [Granulicella cerasi]
MSKKTDRREERIMKELLRRGTMSLAELMDDFEVSAPSIRRDLSRLEARGLVKRTHGGVTLIEPSLYDAFRYDTSYQARELRFAAQKRLIGVAAAEIVRENETVGITAGTTATQVGRALRQRRNISVVTNALNIGMELCNQTAIRTTLTGGLLAWRWTFAMAGPAAVEALRDTFLDKVFLSVTGFDLKHGATTLEQEEALVARTMVEHAKEVIVIADSSKFGVISPSRICRTQDVHRVITDDGLAEDKRAALEAAGISVQIVEAHMPASE